MKTDVRKEVVNETKLSVDQVYDLAFFVMTHGHSTGLDLPELPSQAVSYTGCFSSCPDSIRVWMLDGFPLAASSEMDCLNWMIDR